MHSVEKSKNIYTNLCKNAIIKIRKAIEGGLVMKKIIGIVLATIIMLSTLGILPASADYLLGGTYEYADRNECEEK